MKKPLIGLLALLASCSLFAACSFFNNDSSTPDSSTPDVSTPDSSTPDSSSSTNSHAEALELAKEFVYGQLVEKDIEVSADYTLLNSYYSFVLEETLTISWTVDVTEGVTLENGESECKVKVDKNLEEDLFYVLTATISDSDGHIASFTLERKVLKAAQVIPEKITEAPAEETAYKLYMYQATKKSDLYFTGEMSGFYLATTNASNGDTYEDGVDVYVEKVAGKDAFYLTFTKDNKKQYIGVANNWSNGSYHDNAILADSTEVKADEVKTFEFTWSTEYNTLVATLDGVKSGKVEDTTETKTETFFLGTSGSYYTFGACPVDEAADSYVGCLVKMINKTNVDATDKVAAEKETLSITNVYSGAVEAELPTTGTTFGDVAISWALKSGNATVENNVLKVSAPTEETTITLTATFVCGEASDTADVEITVYPKSPVTLVAAPEEGTAYAFYLYQANKAKNYYFTGAMDGNFLGTTDDASKAADVYVEKSGDGIKIYVLGENDAKSYIKLTEYKKNETDKYYKASVSLAAEGSVFTYNSQFSMWTCNTGNDTFYLGTYDQYTTISSSAASYVKVDNVGVTQFVANFGIIDESALPPAGDDTPTYNTPEEIVNAAYALGLGESLEGTQTLTGVITSVDEAYSTQYKNVTVTIVVGDMTDKPIKCYRLKGTGADVIKVGDTITVSGTIVNFIYDENDTTGEIEFTSGCTLDSYVAGEGGEVTPPAGDEDTPTVDTAELPVIGTEYYLGGTNANGALYFSGTVNKGRIDATADSTKIVKILFEATATAGEYYIYFMDGETKTYILGSTDAEKASTSDFSFVTEKPEDTWVVNTETKAIQSKKTTRFIGTQVASTYNNFSTYAASNIGTAEYATVWFFDEISTPPVEGGEDTPPAEDDEPVAPEYTVVSIPEALAAADGTNIQVSGTVCEINTVWSDDYKNITVTIQDADGNKLYVYRLATKVELGDIVTIKGAMATYNESRQIGAGATAEITGKDNSYSYTEMTIAEALAATDGTNVIVTGTVTEIKTAYSEQYGNISVNIADDAGTTLYLYRLSGNVKVGNVIKVKGTMATYNDARQLTGGTFELISEGDEDNGETEDSENEKASVSVADYASANGWTNGTQYGSMTMNEDITVTVSGGSNTGKYYDSGTNWRIYQNESPSIEIKAAEGKTILSVKITYTINNTGVLTQGDTQIASGEVVTVNANSVTFSVGNTGTATNGQVRITAIEVIYA